MLEILDHRKSKGSKWPNMLLSHLRVWVKPYKLPFDEEMAIPGIMNIESACNGFLESLLTSDQRYFRTLPTLKRNQEGTSLMVYDNSGNLIIEVREQPDPERYPPRIYGYARVSTRKQNPELQIEPLKALGCDEIIIEKISAFAGERPLFNGLLAKLRKGDTLAVWKLDRLGREMFDLFKIMSYLEKEGVNFISVTENIDTKTTTGRVMFGFFSIMAEYEAEIKKERTEAGRELARMNGKSAGRPKGITAGTRNKTKAMKEMYEARNANGMAKFSANEIARTLGISKKTLYKGLKAAGVEIGHRTSVF